VPLDEPADEVARDLFARLPLGYAPSSRVEATVACANTRTCGRLHYAHAMLLCGRCLSRVFCSKGCQAADWPSHKARCRSHCGEARIAFLAAEDGDAVMEAADRASGPSSSIVMPGDGSGMSKIFDAMRRSPQMQSLLDSQDPASRMSIEQFIASSTAETAAMAASPNAAQIKSQLIAISNKRLPLRELRRIALEFSLVESPEAALGLSKDAIVTCVSGCRAADEACKDVRVCLGMAIDGRGKGARKY